MPKRVNRARMTTATTGTGTITLGSATDGHQSFADAGVGDGDTVRYVIDEGNNWEIGTGTYTASGTTLSRTVIESSNSDAAITLAGSAIVAVTETALDLWGDGYAAVSGTTPSLDLEQYNDFSITLSGNTTFTFSNPPASGTSFVFSLEVTGASTYTITWPASVDWAGGTAPDAPGASEVDLYTFRTRDGGTTWFGVQVIDAAA